MPELDVAEQVFDIALHPAEDIIACGTIDGRVTIHRYAPAGHTQLVESKHHSGSVRSVAYTADGSVLFTGSADKSVAALDPTGAVKWHRKGAHDAAVNRIFPVGDSVHLVASGDDAGGVKLWDARAAATAKPVMAVAVNTDFISDMACDRAAAFLLATSGDATLSVFDLRANKLAGRSDDQEDELLSVQVLKGGRKVACGTQNGVIALWSWGTWGDCSDRFPGHPHSVDALLKIDEETLLTGSSDGLIRVVSVQPNKFLGVLGDHGGFPIERLALSRSGGGSCGAAVARSWIASVTHDSKVRFWDASVLNDDDDDDDEEDEEADNESGGDKDGESKGDGGGDGDSDRDGDSDDSDDDDSDESDAPPRGKRKGGGQGGRLGGRKALATDAEKFFSDL
ncbi:WD40-repeat-containing domain protein [Tribonema minus]|uniref:WD40-repeat-containing domain protein n=1 Tax=Tribonema minus TaxID=303371 RepID=A0A836CBA8_9STRA|nr:WD40-repeat-containing domain protein [Tribonema minus]